MAPTFGGRSTISDIGMPKALERRVVERSQNAGIAFNKLTSRELVKILQLTAHGTTSMLLDSVTNRINSIAWPEAPSQ